jgi:valyl-tRNA synthetase
MKSLAQPALDAVVNDDVEFFPKNQKNTYRHWMENIRDWCISRQLWWGHRIPAWYLDDQVFVAESAEEALNQAKIKTGNANLALKDLHQDEDVLDTWFSSWLWPITVFNGFENREEFEYYYPTSVLVTGWDIIFLWVARMVMAGFEWENEKPFKQVYFTGMVRDKKRRKMSKSLGNSPDALKLIEKFGADGVRFGMMMSSPAGGDLLFDEKLCEQGRNFCNKIWNALRLVNGWETSDFSKTAKDELALNWINRKLEKLITESEKSFKNYRISEALMNTYNFIWNDFCSWFLEMIKPPYGEKISHEVKNECIEVFEKICVILHPYMPFITEEIWHLLKDRELGDDCVIASYPSGKRSNDTLIEPVELAKSIITNIRDIRNKEGIKSAHKLALVVKHSQEMDKFLSIPGYKDNIINLANLASFEAVENPVKGVSFICGKEKFILLIESSVDVEKLIDETRKELEYQKGFVASVQKKLKNERFVNNAPPQVVDRERKKLSDGMARIKILETKIIELES